MNKDKNVIFLGSLYENRKGGQGFAGAVFDVTGLSPTLTTMQGGGRQPHIILKDKDFNCGNYISIKQLVKVRKYDIDKVQFVNCLMQCRKNQNKTTRDLADELKIPLTEVGHWFRKDDYFSIPSPDIWHELKNALGNDTCLDQWDKPVTTFIERDGVFEKSERVYFPNKIAPSVLAMDSIKVFSK